MQLFLSNSCQFCYLKLCGLSGFFFDVQNNRQTFHNFLKWELLIQYGCLHTNTGKKSPRPRKTQYTHPTVTLPCCPVSMVTRTANQSATDRENPLYESQELTIEMFQDDEDDLLSVASSQGNLSKIKPPRSSTPG